MESANGYTCDGDDYYAGKVSDTLQDGWCVHAMFKPHLETYDTDYDYISAGYDCTHNGSWSYYSYYGASDESGYTSDADFRICRGTTVTSTVCGLARQHKGA